MCVQHGHGTGRFLQSCQMPGKSLLRRFSQLASFLTTSMYVHLIKRLNNQTMAQDVSPMMRTMQLFGFFFIFDCFNCCSLSPFCTFSVYQPAKFVTFLHCKMLATIIVIF